MSFKWELLFSIYMSIYFNIIDIRKYVIKNVIYNIGNIIPWACYQQWLSLLRLRQQRLEINRKTCEKWYFFWNIISYFQENFLAHSLCHVTYVTYLNKCSDPDVKLAYKWFFFALARQCQKCKISTRVKYFHIFFFNNRYQNWILKIGGRVV